MSGRNSKKEWGDYCRQEIETLTPLLHALGFSLDETQVHIGGERYAFFSEKKLVLVGQRIKDKLKVVIKVSSSASGIAEIQHERQCRQMLAKLNFAYHVFFSPLEILYQEQDGRVIFITKFIEQDCQFLERPLQDQFLLSLKGLEVQEGVQITTYEHAHDISRHFGVWAAREYLNKFEQYHQEIITKLSDQPDILALYKKAEEFLNINAKTIDLYSGFLTHWDFVPHNIRVQGHDIYLLDHSSIRFGNKHESWARFINFMAIHNPELEKAMLFYIQKNRPFSEYLSLRAMRVFRLADIIRHYINTLSRAEGDLQVLNKLRINFYAKLMEAVLGDRPLDKVIVEEYRARRDSLRTAEEKKRQEKLH